jgi:hypothetical protein
MLYLVYSLSLSLSLILPSGRVRAFVSGEEERGGRHWREEPTSGGCRGGRRKSWSRRPVRRGGGVGRGADQLPAHRHLATRWCWRPRARAFARLSVLQVWCNLPPARVLCGFFGIPRNLIFVNNTEMIDRTCRGTKVFTCWQGDCWLLVVTENNVVRQLHI